MRQVDLAGWLRATVEMYAGEIVAENSAQSPKPQFVIFNPRWKNLWLVYVKLNGNLTANQATHAKRYDRAGHNVDILSGDTNLKELLNDIQFGDPTS